MILAKSLKNSHKTKRRILYKTKNKFCRKSPSRSKETNKKYNTKTSMDLECQIMEVCMDMEE